MNYDDWKATEPDNQWEEPWIVWCRECSADITGHPDNGWLHEVTCSRHPDYRPDLDDVPHSTEPSGAPLTYIAWAMQWKGIK